MKARLEIRNIEKLLEKIGIATQTDEISQAIELLKYNASPIRIQKIRNDIEKLLRHKELDKDSQKLRKIILARIADIQMEFTPLDANEIKQMRDDYSTQMQNQKLDREFPKEKEVSIQFEKSHKRKDIRNIIKKIEKKELRLQMRENNLRSLNHKIL